MLLSWRKPELQMVADCVAQKEEWRCRRDARQEEKNTTREVDVKVVNPNRIMQGSGRWVCRHGIGIGIEKSCIQFVESLRVRGKNDRQEWVIWYDREWMIRGWVDHGEVVDVKPENVIVASKMKHVGRGCNIRSWCSTLTRYRYDGHEIQYMKSDRYGR